MVKPPPVTHGLPVSKTAATLCLLGALAWAADHGLVTRWGDGDWMRFVAELDPREVCVVALHGIRGLTHEQIGAWLGGLSRGTSHILWRRALAKLRFPAIE